MLNRGSARAVGLDIGASAVKVIQISSDKGAAGRAKLTAAGMSPVPSGAVENGCFVNPEAVSESVISAFKAANLNPKRCSVVSAISSSQAFVRQIKVPRMTREELQSAIQWEAERYLPFSKDDAVIDFDLLTGPKDSPTVENGQMDVLLVAALNKVIENHLSVLEGAGLRPKIIEVSAFALPWAYLAKRRLRANRDQDSDKLEYLGLSEVGEVYIDIGRHLTNLVVASGNDFRLARPVNTGLNSIFRRINNSDLSQELKTLLTADPYPEKPIDELPSEGQKALTDNLKGAMPEILEELQRSLDYYAKGLKGFADTIFLSGGAALLPGLREVIEKETGLPVQIGQPFSGLSFDKEKIDDLTRMKFGHFYPIAVGLALRGLNLDG